MFTGLIILMAIAVAWASVALYFIGRYGGVTKALEALKEDNAKAYGMYREIADAYAGAGQRLTQHETSLVQMSDQLRAETFKREDAETKLAKHAGMICQRPECNRNIDEHDEFGRIVRLLYSDTVACEGFTFKQTGLWAQQGN